MMRGLNYQKQSFLLKEDILEYRFEDQYESEESPLIYNMPIFINLTHLCTSKQTSKSSNLIRYFDCFFKIEIGCMQHHQSILLSPVRRKVDVLLFDFLLQ